MASGELQQAAEVSAVSELSQEGAALRRAIEATERGLVLKTSDDYWRYAEACVKSGMVPKDFSGNVFKAFIAITFGAELGLSPWMALNSVAMINGRPRLWGDALLGLCIKSGLFDHKAFRVTVEGDGQARRAVVTVRRKPDGNPITKEFSMADAARGGLLGRDTPWKTYPDKMLEARAKTYALREAFADVLSGIPCAEDAEPQAVSLEEAGLVATPAVSKLDALADVLESRTATTPPDSEEFHTAAKNRIKDKSKNKATSAVEAPAEAVKEGGLFA